MQKSHGLLLLTLMLLFRMHYIVDHAFAKLCSFTGELQNKIFAHRVVHFLFLDMDTLLNGSRFYSNLLTQNDSKP